MRCPICDCAETYFVFSKDTCSYVKCQICESVFTTFIPPNLIKTQNEAPDERNSDENNSERLRRIQNALPGKLDVMLDFGCGGVEMINICGRSCVCCLGVDMETSLQLDRLPIHFLDAINMVEVIEHLYRPRKVLREMHRVLRPDGVLYIETATTQAIGDPAISDYCNPCIGHCTIFSHGGLRRLAQYAGFEMETINPTTFIFHRI